ncbi:MAG: AraC family transcriptional regulator, partial [gamma proteobacterium symbiont of Ctena orbiculata]
MKLRTGTTIPDFTDPIGEALHLLRLNGTFYCRSELTAPWGVELPPFEGRMMFHVVTAGQ